MSRGSGKSLEIGLLVGSKHLNTRGRLHGGITAILCDVGIGYIVSARADGRRQITASMTINYRSAAYFDEWVQVELDRTEQNGRKTLAYGRLLSGDRLVAETSILFVEPSNSFKTSTLQNKTTP